jgi:hypothetical protein
MENAVAFVVSLVTVIVIILTITIFILYGATSLFYASGVASIVLGFIDAWLVSKEGNTGYEESQNIANRRSNTKRRKAKRKK